MNDSLLASWVNGDPAGSLSEYRGRAARNPQVWLLLAEDSARGRHFIADELDRILAQRAPSRNERVLVEDSHLQVTCKGDRTLGQAFREAIANRRCCGSEAPLSFEMLIMRYLAEWGIPLVTIRDAHAAPSCSELSRALAYLHVYHRMDVILTWSLEVGTKRLERISFGILRQIQIIEQQRLC